MENFEYITLTEIRTNPYQPRKDFNQEKIKELADSIKENGIIQPIILRKSSLIGYEILAGERRFRAAKMLNLKAVPAIIKELTDDDMIKQAIIENLQREDLNPIEEAKSYQHLIDKGLTHDEIAKFMGKSRPYISNIVRLLTLSKETLEAVKEEKISQGHARLLVSMTEKQQANLVEKIYNEQLSVRSLEKLLQNKEKNKKIKKGTEKNFIQAEENTLKKLLGLNVSIQLGKKNSGKIIIPFENEEEYQRIIHSLK